MGRAGVRKLIFKQYLLKWWEKALDNVDVAECMKNHLIYENTLQGIITSSNPEE